MDGFRYTGELFGASVIPAGALRQFQTRWRLRRIPGRSDLMSVWWHHAGTWGKAGYVQYQHDNGYRWSRGFVPPCCERDFESRKFHPTAHHAMRAMAQAIMAARRRRSHR